MIRLINTADLTLHEFEGEKVPIYAILSHRWGDEELTFKEFLKKRGRHKQGWRKVKSFCAFAADRHYSWVWVDTCCIDKSSSAELSEAINSMFKWYRQAEVCFAYLKDVPWNEDYNVWRKAFNESVWFTRGWTLQELLAPRYVDFVSAEWEWLSTKNRLSHGISTITGIDAQYVTNFAGTSVTRPLMPSDEDHYASVAEVMSWAASRHVTRIEDQAYSLIGLFGTYMPLLYGEGDNAFLRLQKEIVSRCDDETIFTWALSNSSDLQYSGLLAPDLRAFEHCLGWKSRGPPSRLWDESRPPFFMTNKGLQIEPLVWHIEDLEALENLNIEVFGDVIFHGRLPSSLWLMPLNCYSGSLHDLDCLSRPALCLYIEEDSMRALRLIHVLARCPAMLDSGLFERRKVLVPQSTEVV